MIDGTNVLINLSKITKKYMKTLKIALNETTVFSVYCNECKSKMCTSKSKRCTKETEASGL